MCLLASGALAQGLVCPPLPGSDRGQYCVSLKIVNGKLAVDEDAFRVAPQFVRFESQIRKTVRDALAGTGPDPDFLFADLLKQTPDSGLVLNEEEIDPESGTISFSILPLFDSNKLGIELPAVLETRRAKRREQLRKRLRRLDGGLWSSVKIRAALAPFYTNLGLTPQILLFPTTRTMRIDEGPRISSLILPADQVPDRDINRLLWRLLPTGQFRRAQGKRVVDFGDEPYAIPYQIQELGIRIAPLGYTLTTVASARTGASQYVDLRVASGSKAKHHLAAGFSYRPGQGVGATGSGSYTTYFVEGSAALDAGVSEEPNRVLDGIKIDQQTVMESATMDWEPWRAVKLEAVAQRTSVFNQQLYTIEPGVQFSRAEYPWRMAIHPRILIDARFRDCIVAANAHRTFDRWALDWSGRFENMLGNAPIFELPSFGGADTVRGFRADDAIGRRLWAAQNELWHPVPRLSSRFSALKLAVFLDVGGAYQTIGSEPGMRAGLGTGLRLDLRVAVLKLDWAYGFGPAATGGSRGKFYFNAEFPTF